MDKALIEEMRALPEFSVDAIKALEAADSRYTYAAWEAEVCAAMHEDGVGFREAVYTALVENYLDAQD